MVLRPGISRTVSMRDGSLYTTSIDDAWIAGLYSGRVVVPEERQEAAGDCEQPPPVPAETLDIGLVWKTGAILSTIAGRTRFPADGDGSPRWEPEEDWGKTESTTPHDA
ncbi:hypothetical protein GCM10025760_16740 [Microbacterium yannicii]|uniref:Uncharacterized protein n=1 Tax=Microbacterium yannicii TaxID=671622 RepID=A0ABP9M8M0_9MICO